jgi:uncharacterized protein YoxC
MELNEILLSILLVSASALCIYLIITAKRLQSTLEKTNNSLDELKEKIDPLLENLTSISEKMLSVSNEAERQVSEYSNLFDEIREKLHSFTSIKQIFRSENSANSLISTISGIRKGFHAFWTRLFN